MPTVVPMLAYRDGIAAMDWLDPRLRLRRARALDRRRERSAR